MSQSQSSPKPSFDDVFDSFAKEGDLQSDDISLESINKWFEKANLSEEYTSADISAAFSKVAQNKKKISKEEFQTMLGELANAKNKAVEEILSKLKDAGPLSSEGTTTTNPGNEAANVLGHSAKPTSGDVPQKERTDEEGRDDNEENSDEEYDVEEYSDEEGSDGGNEGSSDEEDEEGSAEEGSDKDVAGQQDTTDADGHAQGETDRTSGSKEDKKE